MKPILSARWAETPATQRREPTALELQSGFACDPAGLLALLNELTYRDTDIQREAGNLITGSGIVLSEADAFQISRAVRSNRLNYVDAAGVTGTANDVALAFAPTFGSVAQLLFTPLRFLFEAANTGPVRINVDGIGLIDLRWPDNTPLAAGDVFAGMPGIVLHDGTNYKLFTPLSPTQIRRLTSRIANEWIYLTPGTFTFTVPPSNNAAGTTDLDFEGMSGGGAAGCSGDGSGGGVAGNIGSGGYAGGYGRKRLLGQTPGSTISLTIGVGGTATQTLNSGTGGTTSIGAHMTIPGGTGGVWGVATAALPAAPGAIVGADLAVPGGVPGRSGNNTAAAPTQSQIITIYGRGGVSAIYSTPNFSDTGAAGGGRGTGGTGASGGSLLLGGNGAPGFIIVRA